jgi:hypothetical protein
MTEILYLIHPPKTAYSVYEIFTTSLFLCYERFRIRFLYILSFIKLLKSSKITSIKYGYFSTFRFAFVLVFFPTSSESQSIPSLPLPIVPFDRQNPSKDTPSMLIVHN